MSELDELVRRCQAGELAAFTVLFRRYEARVYRLALAIVRDERDAEDAVQDAFLRAFERIKRFRGDASFDTWFTAVVVNVCRDRLRRRRVRQAGAWSARRCRPSSTASTTHTGCPLSCTTTRGCHAPT